jgi:predicted XRE-type DNA-binding protein
VGGASRRTNYISYYSQHPKNQKKSRKTLTSNFFVAIIDSKESEVKNMNSKELVRKLIEEQGVSQADVAAKMNITPAALWDRISSKKTSSLSVKKLNEILRALGYEVVIMPRAKAGKIDNAYVVEE